MTSYYSDDYIQRHGEMMDDFADELRREFPPATKNGLCAHEYCTEPAEYEVIRELSHWKLCIKHTREIVASHDFGAVSRILNIR